MITKKILRELETRELNEEYDFFYEIVSSSEGNRILSCIQCGTCSASCPVHEVMDYAPMSYFF